MTRTDAPPETPSPPRGGGRTLLLIAAVAAVAVALVVAVALLRPEPSDDAALGPDEVGAALDDGPSLADGGSSAGEALPAMTLPPLADRGPDGGLAVPATGEPMVINFWASWCGPCVNEMPMLQRVADDLDLTMVGVDYIDQPDAAVELVDELGITYVLVTDPDGEFGQRVGLLGTPTTLLVDADGVIRRQLTGELTEQQLRDEIAAHL